MSIIQTVHMATEICAHLRPKRLLQTWQRYGFSCVSTVFKLVSSKDEQINVKAYENGRVERDGQAVCMTGDTFHIGICY